MSKQYFVKVIRGADGQLVYFNFGIDKHSKYENAETSLSEDEYISITVFQPNEFDDYVDVVNNLLHIEKGKLSIHI